MQGLGDRPEIPGTIAQCEWCGFFAFTYTTTPLNYCPNCHHGTLRDDCPHCHAPIAFPPQQNCLSCGKTFTIMKLQQVPGGHASVNIIEPDAKRRKELEAKGNHWHDVVRGKAEGPDLPVLKDPPAKGWTKEDFDVALRGARVDAGEDLTQPFEEDADLKEDAEVKPFKPKFLQVCDNCKLLFYMELEEQSAKTCPICNHPLEPPKELPGVDKPDAPG